MSLMHKRICAGTIMTVNTAVDQPVDTLAPLAKQSSHIKQKMSRNVNAKTAVVGRPIPGLCSVFVFISYLQMCLRRQQI
jgi:hypothetical protein